MLHSSLLWSPTLLDFCVSYFAWQRSQEHSGDVCMYWTSFGNTQGFHDVRSIKTRKGKPGPFNQTGQLHLKRKDPGENKNCTQLIARKSNKWFLLANFFSFLGASQSPVPLKFMSLTISWSILWIFGKGWENGNIRTKYHAKVSISGKIILLVCIACHFYLCMKLSQAFRWD